MAATFRPASPAIMACWMESRRILWTSLRERVDSSSSSRYVLRLHVLRGEVAQAGNLYLPDKHDT